MKATSGRRRAGDGFVLTAMAVVIAGSFGSGVSFAQDATQAAAGTEATQLDAVEVTGTRIVAPGVVSSSPVYSVDAAEISLQQQPEIERILRLLPITAPSDGQNANNGSAGAATINLRGLGSQRNLLMINGKRLTPYNINGLVDTSMIPAALIERIDIITGGASAVYGSDAMSGAINFIMKRNFEGVAINLNQSETGDRDGLNKSSSILMGGNMADGRGNVVLSVNWANREGVQLGQRPLGQLGIVTETGGGLAQFLAGQPPTTPTRAGCGGPGSVDTTAGGSTTTLPTRIAVAGSNAFAAYRPGGGTNPVTPLQQFRDDGSLGVNCSVFNFNPFNYYQTPQERYGGSVIGRFEVNDHLEAYSRIAYGQTEVRQQVAPSGLFGNTAFTPLDNPFITAATRAAMIEAANQGRTATNSSGAPAPTITAANWRDTNGNGIVDAAAGAADYLNLSYRRRTVEFGERSTTYNNSAFQFVLGAQGNIVDSWNYDVSFQRGQSDRTNITAGYTNVANAAAALDSHDGINCVNGDPSCVPLNLFGGFGSITPAMAAYSSATALETQRYTQEITSATVTGLLTAIQMPLSSRAIGLSFGVERRKEFGATVPDECLKLAPASCLGGAGGNTLPITGGFEVDEIFGETILPIIDDKMFAKSLDLELGYRYSDYDPTGVNKTWKYGASWVPVDSLLFRVMRQRAVRAPNVGELAAPRTTGLGNALGDPCSIANAANNGAGTALRARCISTGMTDAQVGTVEDIVSGQINGFFGTNLTRLPTPEEADTTTIGLVFTPDFGDRIRQPTLTVDYYDIDIRGVIGTFAPQEVLDGCYGAGQAAQCSQIIRVGGTLTLPGSGVGLFTTNLDYLQARGVEVGAGFGLNLGEMGSLKFSTNINKYLTQESQSSSVTPVLDCKGRYGNSCGGPLPSIRWIQRTTWDFNKLEVSALWRHLGSVDVEAVQTLDNNGNGLPDTLPQFQSIGSVNYFDLSAGYKINDKVKISALITNVLEKDPPVIGNEAADTRSNSGNTFPSHYDPLGRVFALGLNVTL